MFSSLRSLVEDLESSVTASMQQHQQQSRQSGQPAYQPRARAAAASPTPIASTSSGPSSGARATSPTPSNQSASQLAESALSGLRKSLNRGARASVDATQRAVDAISSPRSSLDVSPTSAKTKLPAIAITVDGEGETDPLSEAPLSPPRPAPSPRPFRSAEPPDPVPRPAPFRPSGREPHEIPLPDSPSQSEAPLPDLDERVDDAIASTDVPSAQLPAALAGPDLPSTPELLSPLTLPSELPLSGSSSEVSELRAQLLEQRERLEEIREMHRLEAKSQSTRIAELENEVEQKDAALRRAGGQALTEAQHAAEVAALKTEVDKARATAREEEEKRIKSISLLKALRQKLVKAETDKETAERERDAAIDAQRVDKARADADTTNLRVAHDQQLSKLRASFDRELGSIRAQNEREATARRGQAELEVVTTKAAHARELAARDARVTAAEAKARAAASERDSFFEQLELRSAEVESARGHAETLGARTTELEYEAREARDRAAALVDELEELRRSRSPAVDQLGTSSAASTASLLAEAESRHQSRVAAFEARIRQLEADRVDAEEGMGRSLRERLNEVERLRAELAAKDAEFADSIASRDDKVRQIEAVEARAREATDRAAGLEHMLNDARAEAARSLEHHQAAREESQEHERRAVDLEARLADAQLRESQLRTTSRTLREELRKVQSSVLMAEKSRNPGVGYFSQHAAQGTASTPNGSSIGRDSDSVVSDASTPLNEANGGAAPSSDAALNFEYLRGVILQFLEHRELRPHLVGVLGVILHFTPAETRRLTAKAAV